MQMTYGHYNDKNLVRYDETIVINIAQNDSNMQCWLDEEL